MLKKLSSRKFWMALLSVITGILVMFGVDDSVVQIVSSIGLIVIPTLVYIIIEGKLDMEGIKKIVDTVENVVDIIGKDETNTISGTIITSDKLIVDGKEIDLLKMKELTDGLANLIETLEESRNPSKE